MRTRRNLVINAIALTAYVIAANPLTTGIAVHEWVSLGFAVIGAVHLALHRDWVARSIRRFAAGLSTASRFNLGLDLVTAAAAATVTVSGLAVSQTLSALAELAYSTSTAWRGLHSGSAMVLLGAIVVHLAMHRRWILAALRLHVVSPLSAVLDGDALPVASRLAAWSVPAVLLAGALTLGALGVGNASSAGSDPGSASATGTLTCPRTGCTATSCHATSGGGGHGARPRG